MSNILEKIENQRLALQSSLDRLKTQSERNRLGQFATPTALAEDILNHAATLFHPHAKIHFLDPAFGTGAFYSALQKVFSKQQIHKALGFEIDPHYGEAAVRLWEKTILKLNIADFTQAMPAGQIDLIVCNPPYVRHHHLSVNEKKRLQETTVKASGMKLSGLAGLYCYFLGLAHPWMARDGIAGWLIPSEFMDVNYGHAVKQYLLERVTLLHVHRFDPKDVQFADALVSSAIVWFRNSLPPENHQVMFTLGGSLAAPKILRNIPVKELEKEKKWTRFPENGVRKLKNNPILSDFFQIKRGIATGDNNFFILSLENLEKGKLPRAVFRPILPSPRYLPDDEIKADEHGDPMIEKRLFLLDTDLDEELIKKQYPEIWEYLEEGKSKGRHTNYICSHRIRWYTQEKRESAPIVCTYLGRRDKKNGRPFRFILNGSRATVANVYLALYPTPLLSRYLTHDPTLIRRIWEVLNRLAPEQLLGQGRVYGGGLYKLEPKELASVDASSIMNLLPSYPKATFAGQMEMFG